MKPYNDTDGKKEQVRAMFDGIARRYDLLNHLLSLGVDRGWRRRVVRAVRAERPRSVLDMATGTADLAIMLAKSCPGARVVGVDLSERMLAVGRSKVERESLSERIELVQGDAESAAYGREAFDAATVAFGVRNFEDIPGGLTGLFSALRPGGKLFVLEFGMPRGRIFGTVYRFYFHRVLPRLTSSLTERLSSGCWRKRALRIATAGIFSEAWRRFIRPAGRTRVKKLKKDDEHEKSMDRGGVRVGRRVVRPHGGYLL